jgi:hypothetical protein
MSDYQAIAFTALPPGWRNIFDGHRGLFEEPCPGVIVSEKRGESQIYTYTDDGDGHKAGDLAQIRFEPLDPPYETEVSFASRGDFGWLGSANDSDNYVTTLSPDESFSEYQADWLKARKRAKRRQRRRAERKAFQVDVESTVTE